MNRVQVVYLHLSVALTTLTGLVFAVMKYAMKSDDPFAAANHPLQPAMLSAHVVIAPLLLFGLGWAFGNHIWPKFRYGNGGNRPTGLWSMTLIVPMTLSAYLMQISTDERLRFAMAFAHWITSGLFVITYAIHIFRPPRTANGQSGVEAAAGNGPGRA